MKRRTVGVIAALLCVSLASSGCGKTKTSSEAAGINADGLPITKEQQQIDIWIPMNGNQATVGVTEVNELLASKELEKATNVKVNWESASAADKDTLFQLMIASGDLPDAFLWYSREVSSVVRSGVVEPLSGYIDKYAKNYKAVINDVPGLKKIVLDEDKELWGMFSYYPDENLIGLWSYPLLRNDWLKKLGVDMPKTQTEWLEALRAIKNGDPNGNGKADEIPMVINGIQNISTLALWPLGMNYDFYLENDKVKYGFIEDKFKDGMQYARTLYQEGLVDNEFLVQDRTQIDRKLLSGIAGGIIGGPHKYMNEIVASITSNDPLYDMQIAGIPMNAEDGKRYSFDSDLRSLTSTYAFYVSSQSEKKELTIRWIDNLFSKDGGTIANYGSEGETYDVKDGSPVFKTELLKDKDGTFNCTNRARYTFGGDGSYGYGFPRYSEKPENKNGVWSPADVTMVFGSDELFGKVYNARKELCDTRKYPSEPNVRLTLEESDELAQIMTDITKYTEEVMAQIITGAKPMEYLDEAAEKVKALRIERAIEIRQAAYDRYIKK